jgi:hypothetical protein
VVLRTPGQWTKSKDNILTRKEVFKIIIVALLGFNHRSVWRDKHSYTCSSMCRSVKVEANLLLTKRHLLLWKLPVKMQNTFDGC